MFGKNGNRWGTSPQQNPWRGAAGQAGQFNGFRPLARQRGYIDGVDSADTLFPAAWKTTLNSGTLVLQDAHPAYSRFTTAATANSQAYGFLSKDGGTTSWLPFATMDAYDTMWAEGWFKLDNIALGGQFMFGFSDLNNPWNAGTINVVNGAVIHWTGTALNAILAKASTRTTSNLTTINAANAFTINTWIKLGIRVDVGVLSTNAPTKGNVGFYVNDKLVLSQTTITNIPLATTALSAFVGINPGTNAARTLDYKSVSFWQENAVS